LSAFAETPSVDDVHLITAISGGDRAALGELYDRYAGLLLAVGLRVLARRREAEDVMHDVFLEVWKSAADYDSSRGSVRTWLLLRMRSRSIDRRRTPAFSRAVPLDETRVRAIESDRSAAGDAAPLGDRERVIGAVAALAAPQREVVELAYFEGLSCTDIATRIGVPVGTVKSRIRVALERLRGGLGVEKEAPA
jgi:RNA polymerase sigma-70 factor (ECF subfamily)